MLIKYIYNIDVYKDISLSAHLVQLETLSQFQENFPKTRKTFSNQGNPINIDILSKDWLSFVNCQLSLWAQVCILSDGSRICFGFVFFLRGELL